MDVTRVQEIVRPMIMTTIPLAPVYVRGLINLRGQVATAIGLRELFELKYDAPAELMNVVCKHENALLSLQVDSIGDVVEVSEDLYESTPQTVAVRVKQFMAGIYKMPGQLLSIIDMDEVGKFLGAKTV
ncbi:MAG: chemotaxis protein CheW [Proteobacteria bacterium]|nr:chemotaxis protein CheW [Pseudomonadota bacterium]